MRELYIKQKVFSLSEKFTVKNQQEEDVYYITSLTGTPAILNSIAFIFISTG